jgi:hypothetical protein
MLNGREGAAGGCNKFRHHAEGTVLFELLEDVQCSSGGWLYGGHVRNDRLAMKRAGHELKGIRMLCETGASLLNYPMLAVFSYRERRLLCTSTLPSKASLVQGRDSNGTVKKPAHQVELVMQSVAQSLLLAKSRNGSGMMMRPTVCSTGPTPPACCRLNAARE